MWREEEACKTNASCGDGEREGRNPRETVRRPALCTRTGVQCWRNWVDGTGRFKVGHIKG